MHITLPAPSRIRLNPPLSRPSSQPGPPLANYTGPEMHEKPGSTAPINVQARGILDVEGIEHRALPGGSGWPGRSAFMSRPVLWSQVSTNVRGGDGPVSRVPENLVESEKCCWLESRFRAPSSPNRPTGPVVTLLRLSRERMKRCRLDGSGRTQCNRMRVWKRQKNELLATN